MSKAKYFSLRYSGILFGIAIVFLAAVTLVLVPVLVTQVFPTTPWCRDVAPECDAVMSQGTAVGDLFGMVLWVLVLMPFIVPFATGLLAAPIAWISRRSRLFGIEKGIYLGIVVMFTLEILLLVIKGPDEIPGKTVGNLIGAGVGWIMSKFSLL